MLLAMEVIRDSDVMIYPNSSHIEPPLEIKGDSQGCIMPEEKSRKSLRNRPSINYRQFDDSSDEESELLTFEHKVRPVSSPKIGVIRGCSECANCQKVLVRWRPGDACRPILNDAPVFYPTEEDFKDTLKYIEKIRPEAEPYGICRIVPPSSWKPTCPLKEKDKWEKSKFSTRVQRVDLLQKRQSIRQMSKFSGVMRKRRRIVLTGTETENTIENSVNSELCHSSSSETFGFEPGPDFTLESFQKYADDFKRQYFNINDKSLDKNIAEEFPKRPWEPSEEDIEGEYWRMVEKPTEAIEVLYGADLETGQFGSGFPKSSSTISGQNYGDQYVKSGWNLNNFPRLTGSVLAFEDDDISGVLVPWLYIGMCFSSFCWHVEDHHFYSLNYMHWGSPKMWYGVPGKDAEQLEAVMKKHLPDLFEEQPDLLHKLVTQFSPSILQSEGVPVYRCVQHSGEFVLTFPRAYHSGFNCGFNCAEAVNVAPVDWLPHGQKAIELYREQGRKISVSHDKLVLGVAREAVRAQWDMLFLKKTTSDSLIWKNICGQDKILVKALKERVEMERTRRELLGSTPSRKMDATFDAKGDKECFICHYDLHLSAVGCSCSPDKFACLNHAKNMCTCDWNTKFCLFRYEIHELNILVDALGGKLSAVHRWGISDLGLSLRAYVTKSKSQVQARSGELTSVEEKKGEKLIQGVLSNTTSCNQNGCNQEENEQKALKGTTLESGTVFHTTQDKGTGIKNFQLAKGGSSSNLGTLDACSNIFGKVKDTIQGGPLNTPNSGGQPMVKGSDTIIRSNMVKELSSSVNNNVADLDERECNPSSGKMKKAISGKDRELSAGAKEQDVETSTSWHTDQGIGTHDTNGTFIKKDNVVLLHHSNSRAKEEEKSEMFEGVCKQQDQPVTADFCLSNSQNVILTETSIEYIPEVSAYDGTNDCKNTPSLSMHENVEPAYTSKDGKFEVDSHPLGLRCDKQQPVTSSQSSLPIITDRYNLPKGPRIAKVVRRINCNVEVLDFGTVLPERKWSTSQAIFPKGYRSRVRYFNILDPSQMCYYVSQILDGGSHGPLFMVQVEHCPGEVFINVSPSKCWEMVRERVNQEIKRARSLGRFDVPSLQPPGSFDGFEMFGLTSPTIVQEIEAMDRHNISLEYWSSRPHNNKQQMLEEPDAVRDSSFSASPPITILQSLLKKANYEELQLLHQLLTSNKTSSPNEEVIQILDRAMHRSSKPT